MLSENEHAPSAVGQATQAGSYATGVSYYPNGAVKQFTYGNGIVHTMSQNARQLPATTADGLAQVYEYGYDANGNVDHVYDTTQGSGYSIYSRWMTYDGLDRLTGQVLECSGVLTTGTVSLTTYWTT